MFFYNLLDKYDFCYPAKGTVFALPSLHSIAGLCIMLDNGSAVSYHGNGALTEMLLSGEDMHLPIWIL